MASISSEPSTNHRTPPIGRHVEVDSIRLCCPSNNGHDGGDGGDGVDGGDDGDEVVTMVMG